jgi:hypothetical protein
MERIHNFHYYCIFRHHRADPACAKPHPAPSSSSRRLGPMSRDPTSLRTPRELPRMIGVARCALKGQVRRDALLTGKPSRLAVVARR